MILINKGYFNDNVETAANNMNPIGVESSVNQEYLTMNSLFVVTCTAFAATPPEQVLMWYISSVKKNCTDTLDEVTFLSLIFCLFFNSFKG